MLTELQATLDQESQEFTKSLDFSGEQALENLTENDVALLKSKLLGKSSKIYQLLAGVKDFPAEHRKAAGGLINSVKVKFEENFVQFYERWQVAQEEKQLALEKDDITLPPPESRLGSHHPVSAVLREILAPFARMGFSIVDGPEIDTDFYNFEALNVQKDHPAREMQDTFFTTSHWVLRTHTSNVQSHAMMERGVPLKIVCPGCVYRNEYDLTHVPAFRQIECLVVDRGIHMGHLRHVIEELLSAAFGKKVTTRLRASYFPFTEPSAEVDVQCQQCLGQGCRSCKHTGWSEIGGAGVVHRKVLESCGIDPEIYSGIAFGFGVERIVKDRFGLTDLKGLFDGFVSFSKILGKF